MRRITENSNFEVRTKSIFFDVDNKTLLFLYQPILGNKTINLYFLLLNLINYFSFSDKQKILTHEFVLKNLNISLDEFIFCRKKLETYNLLKTYYNDLSSQTSDYSYYCFVLYPPLTPKTFLNNKFLSDKLKLALDDNIFNLSKKLLTIKKPTSNIGEDISSSLNQLMNIKNNVNEKHSDIVSRNKKKDIVLDYEWIQSIIKNNYDNLNIDTKCLKLFADLSYIYGVEDKNILLILEKSIVNQNIDYSLLEKNSKKALRKILKNAKSYSILSEHNYENNKKQEAKKYMLELSTFDYYYLLFKNEPTQSLLDKLLEIKNTYDLSYEIINCLLDFSYLKNKKIVINYIKKIAQTIKEKNLYDLDSLMNHLEKSFQVKNKSEQNSSYTFKNNNEEIIIN